MLSAWQRYFGLEQSGSEHEALIATQAVLSEIKNSEAKLKQIEVPEHLFRDAANILRSAFSPTQFGVQFLNHRESITRRATPLALQWASWALSRFDENDIPEESIKSLQDSLAAQEAMLKETDLPDSLREMLERQVVELKTALLLYKIKGVQPLTDAVNKQISEMRFPPADVVAEVEKSSLEVKSALQKGMGLIGAAAKIADHGSKIVKFSNEVYELGSKAAHFGQQLLIHSSLT